MALSLTLTPGYLLGDAEVLTPAKCRSIARPTVQLLGTIGAALIDDGSITTAKLADEAVTTAKLDDGAVTQAKLGSASVSNAKLANMATATVKGRVTSGSGDPEDLTIAQLKTLLATTSFVDSNQSFPGSGAVLTRAHGLAAMPRWVRVVAINTGSAERGYATNDELDINGIYDNGSPREAFAVSCDATNVYVAQLNTTNMDVIPRTGGAVASITPANWRIKIYASL